MKTEGAIKYEQARDKGNIVHKIQNEDKQNKKHYRDEQQDEAPICSHRSCIVPCELITRYGKDN
jgi:hypothetical protein